MGEGQRHPVRGCGREEWSGVLARFAAGGEGVEAFCRREGISESSFRRWQNRLAEDGSKRREVGEAAPGFVDAGRLGRNDEGRIEIRLELGNGVSLRVVRDYCDRQPVEHGTRCRAVRRDRREGQPPLGAAPGPRSYVILKYVRPVIKRRDSQTIHCPAAPAGVIEGSSRHACGSSTSAKILCAPISQG